MVHRADGPRQYAAVLEPCSTAGGAHSGRDQQRQGQPSRPGHVLLPISSEKSQVFSGEQRSPARGTSSVPSPHHNVSVRSCKAGLAATMDVGIVSTAWGRRRDRGITAWSSNLIDRLAAACKCLLRQKCQYLFKTTYRRTQWPRKLAFKTR